MGLRRSGTCLIHGIPLLFLTCIGLPGIPLSFGRALTLKPETYIMEKAVRACGNHGAVYKTALPDKID